MIYFKINKTNKIPIYKQIIDQTIDKVKNQEVKHLDLLPSEVQFESIYNVSSFVVKRAYKILEDHGYIIRIKGRGTYVNMRETYKANALDLETIIIPDGESYKRIILGVSFNEGDFKVRRTLKSKELLKAIKIVTLKNYTPVSYSELYLERTSNFNEESFIENNQSLKLYLSVLYQEEISVITTMNVASSDKINSELLEIDINSPLIVVDSTFFRKTKPVASLMTLYPGDYTSFEVKTI